MYFVLMYDSSVVNATAAISFQEKHVGGQLGSFYPSCSACDLLNEELDCPNHLLLPCVALLQLCAILDCPLGVSLSVERAETAVFA